MSNQEVFESSKRVILDLLDKEFPGTLDLDIFYIEDKSSNRVLKNYDDVMRSWDEGYSSSDNPIEKELLLYRETIRFLTDEQLISHKSEDVADQRTYRECKLTSKGKELSKKERSDITEIAVLQPNIMGVGIDLKKAHIWFKSFMKKN